MISVRITHNAGLGSLFTVLISQLLKIPENEVVHVYATSKLYAPNGENIFDWFFWNPRLDRKAEAWPGTGYDEAANPFNQKLGKDCERLKSLRQMRTRFMFPQGSALWARARSIVPRGTVGIHYRGTDKFTEVPRVPYDAVLQSYRQNGHGRNVFLATDEEEASDWFAARIPGLVINPHQRTDGEIGVHLLHGGRWQAEEAMLDIFCLAQCETLLVGRGNFSDMACIFGNTNDIHYHEDAQ